MSVSRATVARIARAVERARRSLPPLVQILVWKEGDSPEAWRARQEDARREAEAVEATGRHVRTIIIDLEDDP